MPHSRLSLSCMWRLRVRALPLILAHSCTYRVCCAMFFLRSQDLVPKTIMHFLVNDVINMLQVREASPAIFCRLCATSYLACVGLTLVYLRSSSPASVASFHSLLLLPWNQNTVPSSIQYRAYSNVPCMAETNFRENKPSHISLTA